MIVWGILSITKGPLKLNLLPTFNYFQAFKKLKSQERSGKHEKKLKLTVSVLKKIGSNTDTKIGLWFRFPIQKPGFGRKLINSLNQSGKADSRY